MDSKYTGKENRVKWIDIKKHHPKNIGPFLVKVVYKGEKVENAHTDVAIWTSYGFEQMQWVGDATRHADTTFEENKMTVVEWAPLPSKRTEYEAKYGATSFPPDEEC